MTKSTIETFNVECLFENDTSYWKMISRIAKTQKDVLNDLSDKNQIRTVLELINSIAEMHTYREDSILKNLTKNITQCL